MTITIGNIANLTPSTARTAATAQHNESMCSINPTIFDC